MKRLVLALSPLALAACVTVPAGPVMEVPPPVVYAAPVPPPAPVEAWYGGQHFVPDAYGGGWCYEGGPHRHDFFPDRPEAYVLEGGHYHYRGPIVVTYYEGHPAPDGGWCYARGPHRHEFLPPAGGDWRWQRDRGYVYQGAWRPQRPPPATYWPRVSPRGGAVPAGAYPSRPVPAPAPYTARPAPGHATPSRQVPAPAPQVSRRVAPVPAPAPRYPTRPAPAPAPRVDDHDRRDAAPGQGNLPPGHGGTPPGHASPSPGPDRREVRASPGRSEQAPGHGGVPPGQRQKATATPASTTAPAPATPPAAAASAPSRRAVPAPASGTPTRERREDGDERGDGQGREAPRGIPTRR